MLKNLQNCLSTKFISVALTAYIMLKLFEIRFVNKLINVAVRCTFTLGPPIKSMFSSADLFIVLPYLKPSWKYEYQYVFAMNNGIVRCQTNRGLYMFAIFILKLCIFQYQIEHNRTTKMHHWLQMLQNKHAPGPLPHVWIHMLRGLAISLKEGK